MTSSKNNNFRLTNRDCRILGDIALCGGVTAEQINRRHFKSVIVHGREAIHSNCQRRLKLLKNAELIKRIKREQFMDDGKLPYLYTLTPKGASSLAHFLGCSVQELSWRRTDSRLRSNYIDHLTRTNDVRLAIMQSVKDTPELELVTWQDELDLAKTTGQDKVLIVDEGTERYVSFVPDAYFLVRESDGELRSYFLEIDLGSESITSLNPNYRTWQDKIKAYLAYFNSAEYEGRYNTTSGRLLTVTTSQGRALRLRQASEQVGARQRFWFSSFDLVVDPTLQEHDGKLSVIKPNVYRDNLWMMAKGDENLHALCERGSQLKNRLAAR